MTDTLKHLIQQNFVTNNTWAAAYNQAIKVELNYDFARTDTGLNTDTFNVGIPFTDQPADFLYMQLVDHFTSRQKPMALWLWDHLPQWRKYLQGCPVTLAEVNMGMAAQARKLQIQTTRPQHFNIGTVQNEREVQTFANILANLFGPTPEAENVQLYYSQLAATNFYQNPNFKMYVGYKHDQAVVCGTVVINDDTVGIYNIATLAAERCQGFGAAMFHHILADNLIHADKTFVLQASPDGAGIYQRAGFKPVCEVFIYENQLLDR